ncbi:hypothetical protein COT42_04640 [Candidatus Saganbacteria bacterium CG08_land_8_20_14_0_20_45_16]|uniref:Uncharacterized protein n=1 Tax=Candidatus Saganbacteria bacterium CG08_land_8_20_14_0_20_45_16 TaxID=2014293 RepID=A0A2H0XY17_UNCSA|nr:MAG: hypothetical protein COT42_04640 [Candidatus Saganbacteria bacterium CG08_land_8_20_14_0_20_45_16]
MTKQELKQMSKLLPDKEIDSVIREGLVVRLPLFEARRALAKEKIAAFQKKHRKSYKTLKNKGLAVSADYNAHEDFVEWGHWENTLKDTESIIRWFNQLLKKSFGKS